MGDLDALVRPVLEVKSRLGLFEHPYGQPSPRDAVSAAQDAKTLARVAAQRAAVLLKNADELLPLRREALRRIAVVGPLAASQQDTLGPWTMDADRNAAVSLLDGIRAKVPAVRISYAPGVQISRQIPSMFDQFYHLPVAEPWGAERATAEFDAAIKAARQSDVVIAVLGEAYNMSGESASRATLRLPGRQQALLEALAATKKPIVLVLLNGRPLDIGWAADNVPAILEAWYPGTEGGHAVADLLFGDATPGGKLPLTWPRDVGQIPIYYAHHVTMRADESERRTWDIAGGPLFPFGYGLSYTRFAVQDLRVAKPSIARGQTLEVAVDVRNAGARAGEEVVQLYIHQQSGSTARPIRELKGFRRVALAAGETRTVSFTLGPEDLSYWSTAERQRVQEAATFDVWAGADSTATLHGEFVVTP
jgi:beta-glucosidase